MKNLAASVHARLAQRRAKTGEDFNVLLVRFALERLLYRLSRSRHREQFVLERGHALRPLGAHASPGHTGPGSPGIRTSDHQTG